MSVTSSGPGSAAGRDVNSVPVTINANVGRRGPALSVHADHYDQKVVENVGLKREAEHLRRVLADTRERLLEVARYAHELEQTAQGHTQGVEDQARAHDEALARAHQRVAAAERLTDELREQLARRVQVRVVAPRKLRPYPPVGAAPVPRRALRVGMMTSALVGALLGGLVVARAHGGVSDAKPVAQLPVEYVDVPCQGDYVARLASYPRRAHEGVGLTMDQLVAARRNAVLDEVRTLGIDRQVRVAGPQNSICAGLKLDDSEPESRTYVFIGPLPEVAAKGLCARLAAGQDRNCLSARLDTEVTLPH